MKIGSLFSGIGGLELGLERAGMEVVWQVECDDYATRVLEKHWPHVKRFRDVRECNDLEAVDLICGGFPCQDISFCGVGAGLAGTRSGLWREMVRTIRLVRPKYILVENVAALLGRGMGSVLGDLAENGFDAEWDCLSACEFGAPHTRDRVFIMAHSSSVMGKVGVGNGTSSQWALSSRNLGQVQGSWWLEPFSGIRGVAYGVPARVDRLRCLGNAVVPQVAEWIGRRIMETERKKAA